MFGFIKYLWDKYKGEIKLRVIETERSKLLKRMVDGEMGTALKRDWANLNHQEKLLKNPTYKRQFLEVQRLNKLRGIK